MKRLPVKSLIQFRSVSKAWKSLIGSSQFIAQYSALHTEPQHLLVRNDGGHMEEPTYVSVVDDDNFPQLRNSLTPPSLVNVVAFHDIIGSSHGLFCLYGYHYGKGDIGKGMAVIWNISIRKAVAIDVPNVANVWSLIYSTCLGFGVCPETADPKIVKINQIMKWIDKKSETCIPWQVEVFTLSTGTWRSPVSNLPRKSIDFGNGCNIDGVFYWLASDRSAMVGEFKYAYNLIISFDMESEEFKEINLPNNFVYPRSSHKLRISSLGKSLVVLERKNDMNVVWMMEGGAPSSFSQLLTISTTDVTIQGVLGFRKSGEPVIETVEDPFNSWGEPSSLCVYEPNSKHISDLGIEANGSFSVHSYMETLLLIDQPEFAVFDKRKRWFANWRGKTEGV